MESEIVKNLLLYGSLYMVSILVGKDRWLVLFSVTAFAFGTLWLVYPSAVLVLVKEKDAAGPLQEYFLRPFGCYRILNAVLTFRSWKNQDKTFQSTMLLSSIMAISAFLVAGYILTGKYYWGSAVWPIAGIYYLTTSEDLSFSGTYRRTALDKYLRLDALLLLLWGLSWFAFPEMLLKCQVQLGSETNSTARTVEELPTLQITSFERLFILNYASYVISSAILSALAPSFQRTADKLFLLKTRVGLDLIHLVVMVTTRRTNPEMFATNGGLFAMAGAVFHLAFCFLAIVAS